MMPSTKKYLLFFTQSAFDIDYIVELVTDLEVYAATFESVAKKYHNPKLSQDILKKRALLHRKRVADAYLLDVYLEACQRYKIPNYQTIITNQEAAIMEHKEELTKIFRNRWTVGHQCNTTGCQSFLVIDAGLKPYRKVCAAKLSGFREFKESEDIVITGCTAMPQPNDKYCMKHLAEETPVITADLKLHFFIEILYWLFLSSPIQYLQEEILLRIEI